MGQVANLNAAGEPVREDDLMGYAIYANLNFHFGPVGLSLEGKHYRSFFALGANIDNGTELGFAAPEYAVVSYSRPPNAESVYTEPIGAPDVCVTGGRGKVDYKLNKHLKVYGWLGRYTSFSEYDDRNNNCETGDENRTDTWDAAAGAEIDTKDGSSHYWAWIGARLTDRPVSELINPELGGPTAVFYREGYIRYDLAHKLSKKFSLSMLGYHRKRYEPVALAKPWNEGENLLALNFNPHFSFIFGYEYQTRPGFPTHYFNGAIQYRSKSNKKWYHQLTDQVRFFVGQRRAAFRCVGGTCRVFPAFEGGKLELVSRF